MQTNRRSAIAAIAACATVLAIPARAAPADRGDFDKLVRQWDAACAKQNAASHVAARAEAAMMQHRANAPSRTITFRERGFTAAGGRVTLAPHDATKTLSPRDTKDTGAPFAAHPDFPAYCREVEAWEAKGAPLVAVNDKANKAFCAAVSEANAAWAALASYPISSVAMLHEKMEQCMTDALCEDEAETLLRHVAADLARIAGEA